MLLIGEKFDFKQRTFPRGSYQNTKVPHISNCHFVVIAFFRGGGGVEQNYCIA